jgi:fatty-acyl-CoA synthase
VVRGDGSKVTADELVDHLNGRVSKWWVPERWTFIEELPKTSVGKFDKKVIRADYADGKLDVIELELPSSSPGK